MDFILLLLFAFVLVLIFSPWLRAWLVARLLAMLQRRLMRQMENAGRRERDAGRRGFHQGGGPRGTAEHSQSSPQAKLDMDDIATKKFGKPHSEDYVDFEELPKE